MLKRTASTIVIWFIAEVILYAIFCFGNWSFNPETWGELSRVFFALLSLVAFAVSGKWAEENA